MGGEWGTPVTTPAHLIPRDVFGYDEFRGQQAAAIDRALTARDSLVNRQSASESRSLPPVTLSDDTPGGC